MKKVLFVTTISGFLPQFEHNDVKILQDEGCEIHYASNFLNPLYTFDRKDLLDQGIILHQIDIAKSPMAIRTNYKAIRQLKKIIEENEIGMIHCHNPLGGVVARIAATAVKKKPLVIYTAHGFHFYTGAPMQNWLFYYTAERLLAHLTDYIITINKEDYDRAGKFHLRRGGMVFQIHGVGVDNRRFAPRPEQYSTMRAELDIPEGAFHIVTAAELNKNKNQTAIIQAIASLPYSNIYYTLCGIGLKESEIREEARRNGLKERVRFIGFRTDMERVLQTADCFAFPSHREGLGIAAIEALLCGVPLIVADNRGSREYAVPNENAIVCSADAVNEFANAIQHLYENREELKRMGESCRDSVNRFTLAEVGQTMQDIYRIALNRL